MHAIAHHWLTPSGRRFTPFVPGHVRPRVDHPPLNLVYLTNRQEASEGLIYACRAHTCSDSDSVSDRVRRPPEALCGRQRRRSAVGSGTRPAATVLSVLVAKVIGCYGEIYLQQQPLGRQAFTADYSFRTHAGHLSGLDRFWPCGVLESGRGADGTLPAGSLGGWRSRSATRQPSLICSILRMTTVLPSCLNWVVVAT